MEGLKFNKGEKNKESVKEEVDLQNSKDIKNARSPKSIFGRITKKAVLGSVFTGMAMGAFAKNQEQKSDAEILREGDKNKIENTDINGYENSLFSEKEIIDLNKIVEHCFYYQKYFFNHYEYLEILSRMKDLGIELPSNTQDHLVKSFKEHVGNSIVGDFFYEDFYQKISTMKKLGMKLPSDVVSTFTYGKENLDLDERVKQHTQNIDYNLCDQDFFYKKLLTMQELGIDLPINKDSFFKEELRKDIKENNWVRYVNALSTMKKLGMELPQDASWNLKHGIENSNYSESSSTFFYLNLILKVKEAGMELPSDADFNIKEELDFFVKRGLWCDYSNFLYKMKELGIKLPSDAYSNLKKGLDYFEKTPENQVNQINRWIFLLNMKGISKDQIKREYDEKHNIPLKMKADDAKVSSGKSLGDDVFLERSYEAPFQKMSSSEDIKVSTESQIKREYDEKHNIPLKMESQNVKASSGPRLEEDSHLERKHEDPLQKMESKKVKVYSPDNSDMSLMKVNERQEVAPILDFVKPNTVPIDAMDSLGHFSNRKLKEGLNSNNNYMVELETGLKLSKDFGLYLDGKGVFDLILDGNNGQELIIGHVDLDKGAFIYNLPNDFEIKKLNIFTENSVTLDKIIPCLKIKDKDGKVVPIPVDLNSETNESSDNYYASPEEFN